MKQCLICAWFFLLLLALAQAQQDHLEVIDRRHRSAENLIS
jgi:hypothetical protein